jgi:hypothetical protein
MKVSYIFLSVLKLPKLVAGLETSLNEYFSENSNAVLGRAIKSFLGQVSISEWHKSDLFSIS